jgi:hypothetical protein
LFTLSGMARAGSSHSTEPEVIWRRAASRGGVYKSQSETVRCSSKNVPGRYMLALAVCCCCCCGGGGGGGAAGAVAAAGRAGLLDGVVGPAQPLRNLRPPSAARRRPKLRHQQA